jgi:unsaturated rhamnogalacturonyl hydrolase
MSNCRIAACVLLGLSYVACGSDAQTDDAPGSSSGAGGASAGAPGGVAGAAAGSAGALAGVGGLPGFAGAGEGGTGGSSVAGQGGATAAGVGGMADSAGGAGGSGGAAGEGGSGGAAVVSPLPAKADVLATLKKVNDAWMAAHTDPGDNLWARAVYFIGDTEFAKISGRDTDLAYAVKWAKAHNYGLNGGTGTTSADNQCAGQSYIALNAQAPDTMKIAAIETSLSNMVKNGTSGSWTWIDALFMAMPSFALLGVSESDATYFSSMWKLYDHTKHSEGTTGLWSAADSLWWRDKSYMPPKTEPNGKSTFWSRGNGWVFGAHARVLAVLPQTDAHRAEYLSTLQAMAAKLKTLQRTDGFWNVSLLDPTHYGGPETSGTALFTYGMALGVANGWLDRATYEPVVDKAYRAMVMSAVHTDGSLGYVQGPGASPISAQPVTVNSNADFGVGAFLLAGSAVYALTPN